MIYLLLMMWCLQGRFAEEQNLFEDYLTLVPHIDDKTISTKEAEALLFEAKGWSRKNGYFEYGFDEFFLPFYPFIGGALHEPGSAVLGYFAVNPYTGDVWDSACRQPTSHAYERHKAEIRKRFHLTAQHYAQLHAMRPRCLDETEGPDIVKP